MDSNYAPGNREAEQPFSALLKSWRATRRCSQLELATESQISQRHLSFLESGRAQPSRAMIVRLAEVLRVPLQQRNELLLAAGFAPLYLRRSLDDADLAPIREALQTTLRHHEPFPALVVDRHWDVILHNSAVERLIGLLGPPEHTWQKVDASGRRNLLRLTLHPDGLQPLVIDWHQTAGAVLSRLQLEVLANPELASLRVLLRDLQALPGVPSGCAADSGDGPLPPVITLRLRHGQHSLELFSLICAFSSPIDQTVEDLRLELLFPGNAFTAEFLGART